jgi:hypothetical protein
MIVIALAIAIGGADPVLARSAQTFDALPACETQRKHEARGRAILRRELQGRFGVPVVVASRCVRMVQGVSA